MKKLFFICAILFCGCAADKNAFFPCYLENARSSYVVLYNPYEDVKWDQWKYCLSQHHDHVDTVMAKVMSYDNAGYNALSLVHYEGNEANAAYRKERIWPFEHFFPGYSSETDFYSKSKNLKLFVPSMEEVGFDHLVSPFLETYITRFDPSIHPKKEAFQYTSTQGGLDLINGYGGSGIIAHPTLGWKYYANFRNYRGIEIYNAYYEFQRKSQPGTRDYNDDFLIVWDVLLRTRSSKIWGFSVNDHFGPYNYDPMQKGNEEIFDSGKIIVLTPDYSLSNYKSSVNKGAFYAIHDFGVEKNKYPKILDVKIDDETITIVTDGNDIRWFFCTMEIANGKRLNLTSLPKGMNYIRAEVSNENGKVFLQPFTIGPPQ
jgi:hypothetical protein